MQSKYIPNQIKYSGLQYGCEIGHYIRGKQALVCKNLVHSQWGAEWGTYANLIETGEHLSYHSSLKRQPSSQRLRKSAK